MKKIKLFRLEEYVLVDEEEYDYLSQFRWTKATVGYAVRSHKGESILMHRELMGLVKGDGKLVDHKNHNKLDNRKENLRICTKLENQVHQRAKKRKDGSSHSKYKGVSRRSTNSVRPWRCRVTYKGKETTKYFETEIEAAKEYNRLATEIHGEFAYVNKLDSKDAG